MESSRDLFYVDKNVHSLQCNKFEEVIPPRMEVFRSVKVNKVKKNGLYVYVPRYEDEKIVIPHCISTMRNGKCLVSIINKCEEKVFIDFS